MRVEAGQKSSGLLNFLCECGRLHCTRFIKLERPKYESIREKPRRFAFVDGHEILEAEEIVERHDRYLVVEKKGRSGGRDRRAHRPAPAARLAGAARPG